MSLFGRQSKHSNFEIIAQHLRTHLGLHLARPSDDVLALVDGISARDLHHFENLHSTGGMQGLFAGHGIQAIVDPGTLVVALFPASTEAPIVEQRPALRIGDRHATQSIIRPQTVSLLGAMPIQTPLPAAGAAPLPGALEHLEALEHLLPHIVDLFLRHGKLNSADKEVLKQIRPADSSIESRLTALERWQTETGRRVRGVHITRATGRLILGAQETAKPEEMNVHRFDAIAIWISKLIKAFEHTGVKFHNKPMWLPH